jgi:hypothetical protein
MPDKLLFPQKPHKRGEKYEYLSITFWPQNGFIYVEDSVDDSFVTCSRRDWLLRSSALAAESDRLGDISTRSGNEWKKMTAVQERDAILSLVDAMIDVARRAKAQGDPTDPKVVDHIVKHESKRKRQFGGFFVN